MEHLGTKNDAPSFKPRPSPSLEESVRKSIEFQSVQVLHHIPIQLEILQDFHQSCLPLCLHMFTSFMPSHFSSEEPIVFHIFTPPMILYFNPRKCPHLITQNLIQICQIRFIYYCLNFFQKIIQICQVIFAHNFLTLYFNPIKGPHLTPSVDHSNITSQLYSSLWNYTIP